MEQKVNHECRSCGATLAKSDSVCKYCGNNNPNYSRPVSSFFSSSSESSTTSDKTYSSSKPSGINSNKNINWVLFVLLLIFFWPAAIVYLLVKAGK